jgi:uncharacterized membrane protein YeaQ/YmgE (transglycosylase-associated protein family)
MARLRTEHLPGRLYGADIGTQSSNFHVSGTQGFFNLSTWVTAIAGAAVLLLAFHLVTGQNRGRFSGGRR